MVQLITFLLVVAALVILVLQNLTPVLELVVLGGTTVALPLAVWLLSAIAIGALCAWLIYQLAPQKRAYRPIGKRLSDPAPEPSPTNRFVDSPEDSASGYQPPQPAASRDTRSPYDSDWENFRAPEQWDDWGQQQAPGYAARDMPRTSAEDTVRDIESGWGDDGYGESARAAARQTNRPDSGPDIGWARSGAEQPSSSMYEPRTYEEGWLYGSDAPEEPAPEPDAPPPEEPEDVYDANYRVIIPPYDSKDKDG
ncbi:LapA family protein [Leptolyngbya cf. ectocarpi LEGE 11479]|uniref:LapA family protein n=1 Tax=Leptolyngbya cf. ectocarpi LEGE 11479 TaxID=1828722 RepID=A0A928WXZ8_LEPEC|nr:vitamin K epoxide reductase family protein [Leptolyngbya ectocarpi]MBE9065484.1 LapA family protein [Leptolyngbya cf. ectocarpi LEGE 11479]